MKRKLRIILALTMVLALCCTLAGTSWADTHEHNWIERSRTEPTCTRDGSILYVCSCGEKRTEEIPAPGHKEEIIPAQPATCEENGMTEGSRCKVCGEILKQQSSIPAIGHKWGPWQEGKLPTCEEKGKNYSVCANCGVTRYRDDIEPLGHDWDEGVVTKPAGFLEPGEKTVTCARCGATQTEEIPVNMPMDGGSIMDQFRNVPPEQPQISVMNNDLPLIIMTQPVGGKISPDGETMLLSVEATGGTKPYHYQWYQYVDFYEAENRPLGQARGEDSPEYPVEKPGKYYCKVTDSAGIPAVQYSEVVEVTSELYIAEQPRNLSLSAIGPKMLRCRAEGGVSFSDIYDYPYVYWWFDNEDNLVSEGPDFFPEHPGVYYCHVEDSLLDTVDSASVIVYEADPFEAAVEEDTVYLRLGEEVKLRAEVYGGIGPYTGVWLYDGEEIPTQREGDVFTASLTLYDYNMEGYYIFVATDEMDDTASAVVEVVYKQLEIAQQPEGGMLPKDGDTPVELNVVMAEGTAPFKYYLYQNDEPKEWGPADGMSGGFKVYEPGEYFIYIEDAEQNWANSDTALVAEYEFYIEDVTVSNDIGDEEKQARMTAHVVGGKEPVTFRWKNAASGEVLPSEEAECVTDLPGTYICEAIDAAETRVAFEGIEVDYTGETPVIIQQPQDVILPYSESGQYSAQLTCLAASGSPKNPHYNAISFTWEIKEGNGWRYLEYGPTTLTVTKPGVYRCVCRDTYSGQVTFSREAVVKVELAYDKGYSQLSGAPYCRWVFCFSGGMKPYNVEIYEVWYRNVPQLETLETLYESFTTDDVTKIGIGTTEWTHRYNLPDPTGGVVRTYIEDAAFYVVVTDATGETRKSEIIERGGY